MHRGRGKNLPGLRSAMRLRAGVYQEKAMREETRYAASVKLRSGQRMHLIGTWNECISWVHSMGRTVKKARIKAVD